MTIASVPAAGRSPFAHLARAAAPAAEDKDKDGKPGGEDDDMDKSAAEDDEDGEKDKAKKAKKAKKADTSDDDTSDGDEDEDGEKDKAKKAKKAKKADTSDDDTSDGDDDEKDRKDEDDPKARAARARERSRIRAILTSDAGKANPVAAAHIATGTSMSRTEAIELLTAMQANAEAAPTAPAARDPLRSRMAAVPNPDVGATDARPAPNLAEQIVLAGKKRRGEIV